MKNAIAWLFVLTISCSPACATSGYTFKTNHGLNISCESAEKCYSQSEIEKTTNIVIDELVLKQGSIYTYDKIYSFLEEQDGWHDVIFLPIKYSAPGDCGTKDNPDRPCKGFKCEYSPTGWCAGLHYIKQVCYDNICVESSYLKIARYTDCIATSSLAHELIHFFQYYLDNGRADYNHQDSIYWATGCTTALYPDETDRRNCRARSIEKSSEWNSCKETCGNLCEEK